MEQLHELADVVVEVLPPDQFMAVAEPTLGAGKTLVALSVTQLLAQPQLQDLARDRGGRIIVPTGALCGLDALRAVAEGGNVRSVVMATRKPPASTRYGWTLDR